MILIYKSIYNKFKTELYIYIYIYICMLLYYLILIKHKLLTIYCNIYKYSTLGKSNYG